MLKSFMPAASSFETLEVRRMLSGSGAEKTATPILAGCACGTCGGYFCTDTGRMFVSQDLGLGMAVDDAPEGMVLLWDEDFTYFDGKPSLAGDVLAGDTRGTTNVTPVAGMSGDVDISPVSPDRFNIDFRYTSSASGLTQAARDQIRQAADQWERIITGNLQSFFVSGIGTIDDLLIDVETFTSSGGTLAFAGPTTLRPSGADAGLPLRGRIGINANVLGTYTNAFGDLRQVIAHEIGHVLGVGTLWGNLTRSGGSTGIEYFGPAATAEYDRFVTFTPNAIPVESGGGQGTAGGHWDENIFERELLTGFYNFGVVNPLSRFTAATMVDFGYREVDIDAADLYQLNNSRFSNANDMPRLSGFTASPASVVQGQGGVTLAASGVADTRGGVQRVEFYRETNGRSGLQTTLSSNDVLVGTATSGSAGTWSVSLPASQVPAGTSTYYARVVDVHGAYSEVRVASQTVAPDTTPPQVTASAFEFQTNHTVRVNFSEPVVGLTASDLVVLNQTNGQTLPASAFEFTLAPDARSATWRYVGGSGLPQRILPDGRYRADLPAGSYADAAGNPGVGHSLDFFFLGGDVTRDARVDLQDVSRVLGNIGRSNPTFLNGDANYDGRVDLQDVSLILGRVGRVLAPAPSSIVPVGLFRDAGTGGTPSVTGGIFSADPVLFDDSGIRGGVVTLLRN